MGLLGAYVLGFKIIEIPEKTSLRNLLHTAITGGKKLVIIVGTKKALPIAIRYNKPQMRDTLLKGRLMSLLQI